MNSKSKMNPELLTSQENLEDNPKTVEELLDEFSERKEAQKLIQAELLEIANLKEEETVGQVTRKIPHEETEGVAAQIDCYNPSRPFSVGGKTVAAFRVETRGSESDSVVKFFEIFKNQPAKIIENAPVLRGYQDPFYGGEIQGRHIFGAVKIDQKEGDITYKTEFFRFQKSLSKLTKFAEGPERMKDIRLAELPSGRIGVFIRPQGGENNRYGQGKIGYLEVDDLDSLETNLKNFESRAKIFDHLFTPDEWGGVNDIHLLKNGRLGLIGHIAHLARDDKGQETNQKEYYLTTAVFDPQTQEISDLKIMMKEEEILEHLHLQLPHKAANLKSILYPGGSERNPDGTMQLYVGVGDTRAVVFQTQDPFLEAETP